MSTNAIQSQENESNIVPLTTPRQGRLAKDSRRQRFRVLDFVNSSGTKSYRVQGMKRDGTYVRQNFSDFAEAKLKQVELEADFHARKPDDAGLRSTKLSDTQLRLAEVAFTKLDRDEDLILAVNYWQKHGRNQASVTESPRLDKAVADFTAWVDSTEALRSDSKPALKRRVTMFSNSVSNARMDEITPELVETFLDSRTKVSATTKDNDRRAVSRFFSWCIERPRRWMSSNPASVVRVEQATDDTPPPILTVAECKALLRAAANQNDGALAPYVATALFAGLRPFELSRLTWSQVNLKDGEIRLEANQTKTGLARVIAVDATLRAWLTAHKGKAFFPANWRKMFDAVKLEAGFGTPGEAGEAKLKPWVPDLTRHTAISHFFRNSGSYGLTAERHGNSEAIIKKHYQGRVSSADTKAFYALKPNKVK